MSDLTEIEDRLGSIRRQADSWAVNEGFAPVEPITFNELARMLETVVEELQALKGELESHAQQQHHDPPPW